MEYPEKRRVTWLDDETGDLVGACDYYRHDLLEASRAEIERLKTDNENLTASLAGEVTESERLRAEIDALKQQVADLLDPTVDCACGYDTPDDVCQKHYPLFRRLKAERDEALAQVVVTIKEAVNICKDSEASTSDDPDGRMIAAWFNDTARQIQALTPTDAKSALEAYGREKVRQGMKRAAELVSHSAYGTAYWAILAEMEKEGEK